MAAGLLFALSWAGTAGASVAPHFVIGPVAVTGTTPFPGCTAGGTPTSTVFPGAEVEPSISVNPRDPANIVTFYQQDRWNDGGSHGLVASVTHDFGRHWKQVIVPGLSQCAGGTYERSSDPSVSFAPNGDLYAISLSFNANDPANAILVTKSVDGGSTWSAPTTLKSDTDQALQNDKEWVTADPTSSARAYAVWDRSDAVGGQPVWFSRTVDGGRIWSRARVIYNPSPRETIANQIVVEPDGTLIDLFWEGPNGASDSDRPFKPHAVRPLVSGPEAIRVLRSSDHGRTWSAPITIASLAFTAIVDPNQHRPLRTGDIIPMIAVDRHTGRLYVVWQDASLSRSGSAIALSSSGDGGRHWTKPIRVSKTPDSVAQGPGQAWTASVDVSSSGTVGVTYYDFRRDVVSATAPALTDYWAVTCRGSGCASSPARWREQHVGGPFDIGLAPNAGGLFLGDYMGLTHIGPVFASIFTMTHPIPANQQDEYVAAITP